MSKLSVGKLSKEERFQRSVDMAFETGKDQGAAERARIVADIRHALGLDDGRHARHNLDGALIDIEHHVDHVADGVCRTTIRRVIEQLADVESIVKRGDHVQLRLENETK